MAAPSDESQDALGRRDQRDLILDEPDLGGHLARGEADLPKSGARADPERPAIREHESHPPP